MKKIGVLSLYYNNFNYGGLLQAYALVHKIKLLGYDAEQISFDVRSSELVFKKTTIEKLKTEPFDYIYRNTFGKVIPKVFPDKNKDFIKEKNEIRHNSFKKFMDDIPHSKVYKSGDISTANDVYDYFVCGSDQVWNTSYLRKEFLLDFVKDSSKKISYAASIGKDTLSDREIEYLNDKTKDFSAVSLREQNCLKLFKRETTWVLDPTLLLDREEWQSVCEDYPVDGKYVFVYFLGDTLEHRTAVKKFAASHGLKVVTFPHILGNFRKNDADFGDVEVYDAGPAQFLSLIKNSEYVFTDSFHAAVFSNIFGKQYVVFEREFKDSTQKMNSRLTSLLQLFEHSYRLCSASKFSESIFDRPNDSMNSEKFVEMKKLSTEFLINSLNK